MHPFLLKLDANISQKKSFLCVGLDPDFELLAHRVAPTVDAMEAFLRDLIDQTSEYAVAFKPNLSFFEAIGFEGLHMLQRVIRHIDPAIPVILDAKRGDVGHSATKQAQYLFDTFNPDAITVNPYMGGDCVNSFVAFKDKFHFILTLTSNPGANDFQKQMLQNGQTLYESVAKRAQSWHQTHENVGLVVGATHAQMAHVRGLTDLVFLVPGVGEQGGGYQQVLEQCLNSKQLGVVSVSRQLMCSENFKQTCKLILGR